MALERKPVPGYEDQYYLDPESMKVVNKKTGKALKPWLNRDGYAEIQLWKNNKSQHKSLHRLFAEAYIPNPDNLPCINHKDVDPSNYNLDNLEWCTQKYNQNYGDVNVRRGRNISKAVKGKPRPWVADRLGKPVILENEYGDKLRYPSGREAARQLGVSYGSVTNVISGRRKTVGGYKVRYE